MDIYQHIFGCLLGTAVGDAVGLRREGLSRQRASRLYGGAPLTPSLLFGCGFCSDDTEHTQMVGRAFAKSGGDACLFRIQLAREFKRWLLTLPAGVGFATLRACLKLLLGFGPSRSGVVSAGNGPAMRAALLGICAESETHLQELVRASTRLTHVDPRAEEGALAVAKAARMSASGDLRTPIEFLTDLAAACNGIELRERLKEAVRMLSQQSSCDEFAIACGWTKGVSGYVNQTVPAALYCWARSPLDFRQSVENAALLGGDSDTVAAIAGAISGANLGSSAITTEWIEDLNEWPRGVKWMIKLSEAMSTAVTQRSVVEPPSMHWIATVPRNFVFASMVLSIGFRRLLPPY